MSWPVLVVAACVRSGAPGTAFAISNPRPGATAACHDQGRRRDTHHLRRGAVVAARSCLCRNLPPPCRRPRGGRPGWRHSLPAVLLRQCHRRPLDPVALRWSGSGYGGRRGGSARKDQRLRANAARSIDAAGWSAHLPYWIVALRPLRTSPRGGPCWFELRLRQDHWSDEELRLLRQAAIFSPYRDITSTVTVTRQSQIVTIRLGLTARSTEFRVQRQLEQALAEHRAHPKRTSPPAPSRRAGTSLGVRPHLSVRASRPVGLSFFSGGRRSAKVWLIPDRPASIALLEQPLSSPGLPHIGFRTR